ncbi:hypothetical protein [Streptomyces sp. NPDC060027]|uniref:hypothetical protein n=1 Tax=Streptomyces sp. NPDC060027 TaxID=3347040 RepID=UPI003692FF82
MAGLRTPRVHDIGEAVREADRHLTKRAASRIPPGVGRLLPAVEGSKLWCGAAVVMAAFGGRRGRRSAVSGRAALALAQLVSNGLGSVWLTRHPRFCCGSGCSGRAHRPAAHPCPRQIAFLLNSTVWGTRQLIGRPGTAARPD